MTPDPTTSLGDLQRHTVHEVAQALGIGVETVKRWIRDGKLRGKRIGMKMTVNRKDLEAFLNE